MAYSIPMNPFSLSEDQGYFWLRGNLHCHTTNSDGHLSPQERVDRYAEAGYDFLCLSDHDRITDSASVDPRGMTLIRGVELHPSNPFGGQRHHFLAYNVSRDMDARSMHPQEVIDAVAEQNGTIWVAHPYWSSVNARRDLLPLKGLAGIEVFNTTCARHGRADSGVIWDDWMDALGRPIPAIANDDAHNNPAHGNDEFQGWTVVRVRERSAEAILQAIMTGQCYSTAGPEVRDFTARRLSSPRFPTHDIELTVHCSPARRICAVCDVFGADTPQGPVDGLFETATLHLRAKSRWFRLEIEDHLGRKAWTNPFDLAGLAPRR